MSRNTHNQAQKAYLEIRDQLIARVLPPGVRLAEKHWAEQMGVNRSDIREAFSRLQGEGLLQPGERGGFFVKEFSPEEMAELNEVRIALETTAAQLAIERATADDIKELESLVDLMEAMAAKSFGLGVFEADLHFHELLIRTAHNRKLEELYKIANLPLSTAMAKSNQLSGDQLMQTAKLHRSILNALKDKNAQQMLTLLRVGVVRESNRSEKK